MDLRTIVRPIPGARRMSSLRQRMNFVSSADYWERRYARQGTSGEGSYGAFARRKAEFINKFVREHGIWSVIEFGCGDGNQLSLAEYPRYMGLDVSRTAIGLCKKRFAGDCTKSFYLYDGTSFVDHAGMFAGDLALSLDVVYHLVEDTVFENYMTHLFSAGQSYVIIYATNTEMGNAGAHVRHRRFVPWVEAKFPQWQLLPSILGTPESRVRFFVYERLSAGYR
jgi:hypothetical protein